MNLKALIAAARARSDDVDDQKPLWSDAEWTSFANRAQREACRRARLIVDSSTDEVTLLAIGAGEPTKEKHASILFIRRVKLVGGQVLRPVSFQTLDCQDSNWEEASGTPRGYVPDFDSKLFRLYPTPDADVEVRLTVVRLPLADMVKGEDEPEIAAHLHDALIDGMLDEAYSKQDSQTFDPRRAEGHAARFAAEFGARSTAVDEAWIEREHGYLPDEGVF